VYSLEYTKIPKAFFTPHHRDDVSRITKGITKASMVSKVTMVIKTVLQQCDPGSLVEQCDSW
jgi:hypothetical protein